MSDPPRAEKWWVNDDGNWPAPDERPASSISDDPRADAGARRIWPPPGIGPDAVSAEQHTGQEGSKRRILIAVAVLLTVVVGVGVRMALTSGGGTPTAATSANPGEAGTPGPVQVVGQQVDGNEADYSWSYTNSLPTDTYLWRALDGRMGTTSVPNMTLSNPAGQLQCLQVKVQRADGPKVRPTDDLPTWSRTGCVQN